MVSASLSSSSWRERRDACRQLRGDEARRLLPQLLTLRSGDVDRDVRQAAGEALAALRNSGVAVPEEASADALSKALASADGLVRRAACREVGLLGAAASQHVEKLLMMMAEDPWSDVRTAAQDTVVRLKQLGVELKQEVLARAVAVLAQRLDSCLWQVRRDACCGLGVAGPQAEAHRQRLQEVLDRDCIAQVRTAAVEALARLDSKEQSCQIEQPNEADEIDFRRSRRSTSQPYIDDLMRERQASRREPKPYIDDIDDDISALFRRLSTGTDAVAPPAPVLVFSTPVQAVFAAPPSETASPRKLSDEICTPVKAKLQTGCALCSGTGKCQKCDGKYEIPKVCDACDGNGRVGMLFKSDCPECSGRGLTMQACGFCVNCPGRCCDCYDESLLEAPPLFLTLSGLDCREEFMGTYQIVTGNTIHGMPYWEKLEGGKFMCNTKDNFWVISASDAGSERGWFRSNNHDGQFPSAMKWEKSRRPHGNGWIEDSNIKVMEGAAEAAAENLPLPRNGAKPPAPTTPGEWQQYNTPPKGRRPSTAPMFMGDVVPSEKWRVAGS